MARSLALSASVVGPVTLPAPGGHTTRSRNPRSDLGEMAIVADRLPLATDRGRAE